jgi:hypothetical protein
MSENKWRTCNALKVIATSVVITKLSLEACADVSIRSNDLRLSNRRLRTVNMSRDAVMMDGIDEGNRLN